MGRLLDCSRVITELSRKTKLATAHSLIIRTAKPSPARQSVGQVSPGSLDEVSLRSATKTSCQIVIKKAKERRSEAWLERIISIVDKLQARYYPALETGAASRYGKKSM